MITKTLQLYRNALSGFSRDIWTLAIIMLINRSGMMVLPFMAIYLREALGFSLPQTGMVLGAFGAGALTGTFSGGKLTDRFGYYPVMFWTLFIQGFMFFLLLQADTFISVCILIYLTSSIGDAFRPANYVAIATYSSSENRTRALGLQRLAINLGMAIGPAIGGLIVVKSGYSWLFVIDGITCITAAILLRILLKPKAQIEKTVEAQNNTTSPYRDIRYLLFLGLVLLNAIAFFQLFTTLPVFFKEQVGMLESQIGQLMAYSCLIIVVIEMPLIYSIEGRWSMLEITAFGAFLIGFSFVLFNLLGPSVPVAFLMISVLTFGEILTLPFLSSVAMERADRGNKGDYMGLYAMMYSVAHILAPLLGTQIANIWSFQMLWFFMGGIGLIVCFGLLSMRKKNTELVNQAA